MTVGGIPRTGVYNVDGVEETSGRIAVNLLDEAESDCGTRDQVTVNAARQTADLLVRAAPRELWPWCVAVALCLLSLEWLVWLRRNAA